MPSLLKDTNILETLMLILIFGAMKLERSMLVADVISTISFTVFNDEDLSFSQRLLERGQFSPADISHFTELLCEESLRAPSRSFSHINILRYLSSLAIHYPQVLVMRWPKCSFMEAVCFMCQHEACVGHSKADHRRQYFSNNTADDDGMTDRILTLGLPLLS